jgi:hypothetical protein
MLDARSVAFNFYDRIANHGAIQRRGRSPGAYPAEKKCNNQPAGERHVLD